MLFKVMDNDEKLTALVDVMDANSHLVPIPPGSLIMSDVRVSLLRLYALHQHTE